MTKQHFIALADTLRHNRPDESNPAKVEEHNRMVSVLADFCQSQNGNFKRERWMNYIAGKCGSNGGAR